MTSCTPHQAENTTYTAACHNHCCHNHFPSERHRRSTRPNASSAKRTAVGAGNYLHAVDELEVHLAGMHGRDEDINQSRERLDGRQGILGIQNGASFFDFGWLHGWWKVRKRMTYYDHYLNAQEPVGPSP